MSRGKGMLQSTRRRTHRIAAGSGIEARKCKTSVAAAYGATMLVVPRRMPSATIRCNRSG